MLHDVEAGDSRSQIQSDYVSELEKSILYTLLPVTKGDEVLDTVVHTSREAKAKAVTPD